MSNPIKKCDVRMYKMGTGDCFVLTFWGDDETKPAHRMMIDCGAIHLSKSDFKPFQALILDQTDGKIDTLVVTHEHRDHVAGFDKGEDVFNEKFEFKEVWFAWTEDDTSSRVKRWKREYGKKKMALAEASRLLLKYQGTKTYQKIFSSNYTRSSSLAVRNRINHAIHEFAQLNSEEENNLIAVYSGGLKGMDAVKKFEKSSVKYLDPGDVIEGIEGLDNIRIYVLGPATDWRRVKHRTPTDGEVYAPNEELSFIQEISSLPFEDSELELPFHEDYLEDDERIKMTKAGQKMAQSYRRQKDVWRRIDFDWLYSATNLSLRITEAINNLSLVLAIEFVDSNKVMLFPGDAEFESWRAWHKIKWGKQWEEENKPLVEDLLSRTVFYKVAHHLSSNGTASEQGLQMMRHKDLVAMATLDYDVIMSNWKSTMPSTSLLDDLLAKTKGRLMVSNVKELLYDRKDNVKLSNEIKSRQNQMNQTERSKFKNSITENNHFIEFTVDGEKNP